MQRTALALLLFGNLSGAHAAQAWYREPALRGDTVVFVAEGDLWSVPAMGGRARRLSTHPAQERQPVLSADGTMVAFVASYDGMNEVYLMPVAGGQPRQISFDGGNPSPQAFTPTGELIYATDALVGPPTSRVLRVVDPDNGTSRDLPLADANQAALDASGKRLWFTRWGLHVSGDNALDYRGGAMAQLWCFELDGGAEATRLASDWNANVSWPMVWQDRLVVLADADGRPNLYALSADGSERHALTRHADFDVRWPSLDGGRIVYQLGADLRLLDLASGEDRAIPIELVSDFEQRQPRWLKSPLDYAESVSLSPQGDQVLLTARGRVALASTGKRRRVDLAAPADARLRGAIASHDGRRVYVLQERAGDSEIWSYPADGSGPGERLVGDGGAHRWRLHASPDGRWLVHEDKQGRLQAYDLEKRLSRLLEQAHHGLDDAYGGMVFSADGKWIAYARPDSALDRRQIVLLELASGRAQVLTSDRYESFAPAFSPDGRWLYFLSSRHFEATPGAPWGDRNVGPMFDRRVRMYALALQPGTRFPYAPGDELTPASAKDAAKAVADVPAIVTEGLVERLFELPVDPGNYEGLAAHAERLYLLQRDAKPGSQPRLLVLALDAEAKPETLAEGVLGFELTPDRKRLMLVKAKGDNGGIGEILLLDAGAKLPEALDPIRVRTGDWALEIDPPSEWRGMFFDAWRMHREFSFDPTMRGQDWQAVRARYEPLLQRLADRADLNDLLAQMIAELGVLHSQVRGAELRRDADAPQASALGARFTADASGLRVDHIFRSDPELPGERAPLAQPGVDVRVGDRLLAVNGRAVRSFADLTRALRQQAGQQVLLTVQRGTAPAHRSVVLPVSADREAALRYGDWVQGRRAAVERAGAGRIGYLHLRAMGPADMAGFVRELYAQIDREGLIVDARRNRGGNIDSWVIDRLLRRAWAFWQAPGTSPAWNQQQSFRGHVVVLADQMTYSDGETFAAGVKALGLAPVIGMRTAGAGIWLSDRNTLADRGLARIAEFAQFDALGRWLIEGRGVAPDIEIDNPPFATAMGGDAQLDAAITWLQQRMREQPLRQPPAQPLPPRGTPGH
ncbi:MAG: PD40 domain-containing protein [Xanthomonadales bacterium]|nr:Tricorn protease [Xanthomonadales bacterium]MCC6591983.1 PD40 domain-containing protein [Xanthomonadales bacterium]MCE7930247.1 peptidase S41 [Xanthomonadales bacterium PRO6]